MAEHNFDFSSFSEDDVRDDGRRMVEPGRYHAAVRSVDDSLTDDKSGIRVDFEILAAATDEDPVRQAGLYVNERLSTSEKAASRIYCFAKSVGLIGDCAGQSVALDLQLAVGRELIIRVVADKFTGRDGSEVETRKCAFHGFAPLADSTAAVGAGDDFDL